MWSLNWQSFALVNNRILNSFMYSQQKYSTPQFLQQAASQTSAPSIYSNYPLRVQVVGKTRRLTRCDRSSARCNRVTWSRCTDLTGAIYADYAASENQLGTTPITPPESLLRTSNPQHHPTNAIHNHLFAVVVGDAVGNRLCSDVCACIFCRCVHCSVWSCSPISVRCPSVCKRRGWLGVGIRLLVLQIGFWRKMSPRLRGGLIAVWQGGE